MLDMFAQVARQPATIDENALDHQVHEVEALVNAKQYLAAIDLIVDQAQTALSEYLGVPNPDEDDEMEETETEPVNDTETGAGLAQLSPQAAMSLLELLAM
jgi:hypothetical protein